MKAACSGATSSRSLITMSPKDVEMMMLLFEAGADLKNQSKRNETPVCQNNSLVAGTDILLIQQMCFSLKTFCGVFWS